MTAKRYLPFVLAFSAIMTFLTQIQAETYRLDLSKGATKVVPRTNEIARMGAVPGQNVSGLPFILDTDKRNTGYIEMLFGAPIPLPKFEVIRVHMKLYAPENCPARSINVRIRDKDGEVFQFAKRVDLKAGGFYDFEWEITPSNARDSWGKKANKILDMPAALHTVVVSYPVGIPGKVYLIGLEVEHCEAIQKLETIRPLCTLDDYRLSSAITMTRENSTLVCSNITKPFGLGGHKFSILRYEQPPVKLVFDADLQAGEAKLVARFRYADKAVAKVETQQYSTPAVKILPGRHKTEVDLTQTLKETKYAVRPSSLELRPVKGSIPVKMVIHGIEIVELQSRASSLDFDLLTGTDVHVLRKGTGDIPRLVFTNRARTPGRFAITMEFEHFFGAKKTEHLDLPLAPGERREIVPKWRPDLIGHWTVRAIVRDQAEMSDRCVKERSLAWFRPSGPTKGRADGFLFSVCTHTGRWGSKDRQREVEAASLCGIKVVRIGCSWYSVQPRQEEWKWTMFDELLDLYTARGIEIQTLLWGPPAWAISEEHRKKTPFAHWKYYPEDINGWREYVRRVGERYRGRIRYYEVWNEPDLKSFSEMTLQQYVSLQKAAYEEMAKVDPSALVMTGGFTTLTRHPGLIYPDFQRDFLVDAKGYFKIHAIHLHGWFHDYHKRIDRLFIPVRKATGTTVPWYSNETAMTSVGGFEKKQAGTLMKKLLFAWVRGAIGYTWYDLRNDGYDPKYGEHHFGMVTNDFYPKPIYSSYNMLTSLYSKMKTSEDLSPDSELFLFRFGDGHDILLPAWCESTFDQSRHVLIDTDAKSVSIVDLMGNEKPLDKQGTLVVYGVGSLPQTLKLSGATKGNVVGELIRPDKHLEAVPGRLWTLPVSLLNPLNRKTTMKLELTSSPTHLTPVELPDSVILPPSGKASVQLKFKASDHFTKPVTLPLRYEIEAARLSGVFHVTVRPAKMIPQNESNRPADFKMDKQNQVTATTPADPFNSHRLWSGPDDASVEAWLHRSGNSITLKVSVTDDVDRRPDPKTLAKGDQVRLYFLSNDSKGMKEFALIAWTNDACQIVAMPEGKPALPARARFRREGTKSVYDAKIPLDLLGTSPEQLEQTGIRFAISVADDDGEGVDSWLHPGIEMPDEKNMPKATWLFFRH